MSVYVSIQLSAHVFAIPPAAGFVCCTAAIRLAATSLASVYWLGEVVGPVAQRFGEGASTSRTFSAITDLIAVVQREADRLFVSIFQPMYACSTSSCLPAGIVVDYTYVLTVKASPPDVEMARLVALRYGGESASVSGCLCDGTGTFYRLFSVTSP